MVLHPELSQLISQLQADPNSTKGYSWQDDILRYKDRVVISPTSTFKSRILAEMHSSPIAGNSGFQKTYARTRRSFFWTDMKKDILTFVTECEVCLRHKGETVSTPGTLQPLPILASIWTEVSMDFITEWWYNTNYHATTKLTPYEAVYGQLPPSPTSYLKGCSKVQAVDQLLQHHATMLAHLRENLNQAQNRMKQKVDQHRSERQFQEGDQVFLRLQPYKQTSLKDKGCQKLSPKFYGPYQVLQRIGEVAYKLALPPTAKIHPVFHVSCLKKVIGNNCRIQTSLPKLDEEGSILLQPEQVLDTQVKQLRGRMIKEVLVKWKDTSPEDATWEPATILQ
eukprot:PITA_05972